MTLARGRDHLAIPGPSVFPDRVLRAMHRAAPNIYEGELIELTESVYRDLNRVAGNDGSVVMYLGNGHAAWEATLCNTLSRGDRVLAITGGRFGQGWAAMARELGIDVEELAAEPWRPVEAARVEAVLAGDSEPRIKAVLAVQTDTSSSLRQDIRALRRAIDGAGHPARLFVDAIASFACEPMHMADWGVDAVLAASQKGLMTPPGVALVFIRDTIWDLHARASLNTPYWDWRPRANPELYYERFCGTAPTHHLFGLRAALDMLFEEGIEAVWHRHACFATMIWHALDAWASVGGLHMLVPEAEHRSRAVTTITTAEGDARRLRDWCERDTGVTLGLGLPLDTGKDRVSELFRIGHMGHLNPPMLLGTLACIDAGLKRLGIPHGDGALDAATRQLASSCRDDR